MIQFGIFVTLFIAIALCFLLIPLWIKPQMTRKGDSEINIELAQKKLRMLEMDLENGVITQAQYEPLKNELMLNLHRDLKTTETLIVDDKKGRWLAIPLAIFVPLLGLAIYSIKGDLRAFDDPVAVAIEQTQPTKERPNAAQINAMVEKLAQKMKDNPNDSEGWLMLARSYKVMKRYPESVDALRKAMALTGETPDVLLQLADVIAMKNNGSMLGEPEELVEKVLAIDANNDMALWLYGLAKAEDGKFNAALIHWKKLQSHYQPDSENFKEVQNLINQANEALGQKVEAQPETTSATNGKNIRVSVAIDEKLKVTANPDDTVFIYAQPAQGGKMPLAVVKKQVKDLPLEIILDDSMAMMPNMTISSVANVLISARISHSGNAIAQAGEPIAKQQVSTVIDNGIVNLTIRDLTSE